MIKLEITANSVEEYKEIIGQLVTSNDLAIDFNKVIEEVSTEKEPESDEVEDEEPKKTKKQKAKPKEEPAEKVDDSTEDEKATESEKGPTKDELTNLIKACLDKGLRKEVIAAFDQFGAKKFPQVEESDYAALKEVLEELVA